MHSEAQEGRSGRAVAPSANVALAGTGSLVLK